MSKSVKLTEKQKELRESIKLQFKEIDLAIDALENKRIEIYQSCPHVFPLLTEKELKEKWWGSASCSICKGHFGWRCLDSPDEICHFISEVKENKITLNNGKEVEFIKDDEYRYHSDEYCIYCHGPDDRQ